MTQGRRLRSPAASPAGCAALVLDPTSPKAAALSAIGVELARGDLSNAATIRQAMIGAWGVFSVQPNSGQGPTAGLTDEDEFRYGTTVADLAVEAGVAHLVYSSAVLVSQGPTGIPNLDVKLDVENYIRTLDLRSTVVRPGTFMELLLQPGMGLDQGVISFFMHPDEPGLFIAAEDIGNIVASIFDDPERFAGRAIDIAGDAPTGHALGETLSRAAGKPIRYQRFPDEILSQNASLGRAASVFDEGRARSADIVGLRREFGDLLTFETWLAGTGKPLLLTALKPNATQIAMR